MATSLDEDQSHPASTVAEFARLCMQSFQNCLDKAANVDRRELCRVEDQLARFSLWTANIHVFSQGRDSLDHRLREAPDVQSTVIGLLHAVNYRIQSCSRVLDSVGLYAPNDQDKTPLGEANHALSEVQDKITLLHKISNTIRRASKDTQNMKVVKTFEIKDDEGNNVESFLQTLFTNHIRDQFPGCSDIIQERLANSMLMLRKRVLYRRIRYGKTSIQPQQVPSQPSISRPNPRPTNPVPRQPVKGEVVATTSKGAAKSVTHTATTLSPEKFQRASNPSVVSVSRTVALSSHEELRFPPSPCGSLLRKYNKFKKENEEEHKAWLESLPGYSENGEPRPAYAKAVVLRDQKNQETLEKYWEDSLDAIGEVVCPFCFYTLPVRDVVNERKWKLHVKNDLDPYVCLFEDCDSPDQLYSHSSIWLNHMREHALRWRCTSKSHAEFTTTTKDEYLNHMKTSHPGKFTDAQLTVLAQRNSRVFGPLFKSCPLCGIEELDNTMEDHIVGHLRFLALKSLPSYQEDPNELGDENDSQDNSSAFSKPQSRSTIKNDADSTSTLDFAKSTTSLDFAETETTVTPPDASTGFVDDKMLGSVSGHQLRDFEWGFIPYTSESSVDLKDDPIIQAFMPKPSYRRLDPDCAICHAPATLECDCEAKSLEAAVFQAEKRMMTNIYDDIRQWVRAHSQDFILSNYRTNLEDIQVQSSSQQPNIEKEQENVAMNTLNKNLPSKQEVNELWEGAVERYPEVLEYFFGLVELTLPADDEPALRDPPFIRSTETKLQRKRKMDAENLEDSYIV